MKTGLVLGKFYPLHTGHIGLIGFARARCDELTVLICASDRETISGALRLQWLEQTFRNDPGIKPVLLEYLEDDLPNTSVSSEAVSQRWARKISTLFLPFDVVFSSEAYGTYLAHFLHCVHIPYDPGRAIHPVSGSVIRQHPLRYWEEIADAAKPFFVKKISILGTESTGKSTLAERLAKHYHTTWVPEMAREIVEHTQTCTLQHLQKIAHLHAQTINQKLKQANKLLFVDTDVHITRSYARFLFGEELAVAGWMEEANRFHLSLYLNNDTPFVQDGTRLEEQERNKLHLSHLNELDNRGIGYHLLSGSGEEKFDQALAIIDQLLL